VFVSRRRAIFSRQFWRWLAWRDASLVRTNCRSGGISNTQILPDARGIHKAILRVGKGDKAFFYSYLWLRGDIERSSKATRREGELGGFSVLKKSALIVR
jgi:hypothetical protein